jgi:hypothetical protein
MNKVHVSYLYLFFYVLGTLARRHFFLPCRVILVCDFSLQTVIDHDNNQKIGDTRSVLATIIRRQENINKKHIMTMAKLDVTPIWKEHNSAIDDLM